MYTPSSVDASGKSSALSLCDLGKIRYIVNMLTQNYIQIWVDKQDVKPFLHYS